jgi:hypothetical protein
VRLRAELETRALTVLVDFPAGWTRAQPGYYEAAEDVVFLDGALEMNGVTYRAGDWAHIPGGRVRRASVARERTIALARFGGGYRWVRGDADTTDDPPLRRALEPIGMDDASPFGHGRARLLRSGSPDASWLLDSLEPGTPSAVATELLDLAARAWAWVPAGDPLPAASGLCFARTFEAR